jgi:hypothetical protein
VLSLLRLLHLLGASSFIAIAIAVACESPVNCRWNFSLVFRATYFPNRKFLFAF